MVNNTTKTILIITNSSAKKALGKVKSIEDLKKIERKWRFIFSEKQGILIFDSSQCREKFINYFSK